MNDHFCAGVHVLRHNDGKYEILGVTAQRFEKQVKLPGGTNKNSKWETKEQTFEREFSEETGLKPISYHLVHSEPAQGHMKYFFVCKNVQGYFDGPKVVKEPDGDELTIQFWDLDKFEACLFNNHRTAFMKVCQVLKGSDTKFEQNYPEICEKLKTFKG